MLDAGDCRAHRVDGVAQVQTQIRGHLIVTRASGVQLLSHLTDTIDKTCFYVHVHIFELCAPRELPGLYLGPDCFKPLNNGTTFFKREHIHMSQHLCMRDRTGNVIRIEPTIEIDGGTERLHCTVRGLGEAPAPGFVLGHGLLVTLYLYAGAAPAYTGTRPRPRI